MTFHHNVKCDSDKCLFRLDGKDARCLERFAFEDPAETFGDVIASLVARGWTFEGDKAFCRACSIVGRAVQCEVCHRDKVPRGRDSPAMMHGSFCDDECPGHRQDPFPGDLWPGEKSRDFGYPCSGPADKWPVRTAIRNNR